MTLKKFLKDLSKETDIDKIDLMSADSESDLDTLKQFVKDEYGVVITREWETKDEILGEAVVEIKENVEAQQKEINKLFDNNNNFKGKAQEILSEIKNYSPFTEKLVISTLIAIGQKVNVINVGEKGHSKTYSTKGVLDMMSIPYNEIKGHITPKKFYELAKLYNDTLILIDESAVMLSDREIRNLLLSLLQRERVYWRDDYFDSSSTLIFNSNHIQDNPVMRAVMDRCITNVVKLESDEIREKIMSSRSFTPNKEIWENIKNNLFRHKKLDEEVLDKVFRLLEMTEVESMRDKWRYINIAECSMKVLGNLNFLKYFSKINSIDIILAMEMDRKDKVKLIAKETGKSVRTAQRIAKERGI